MLAIGLCMMVIVAGLDKHNKQVKAVESKTKEILACG